MHLDVVDLRDFYASPVGQMVARQLAPVVGSLVRADPATRVLGFGFATPYLGGLEGAERVIAFMPAGQGVIDWPAGSASATALVEEDSLPLPDSSIDLVVLVHALEMSERPQALMAELRRVLTSGGRLIVVVPNRQGPWACDRSLALRLRPALFARAAPEPLRAGGVRGGDLDERAPHGAGLVAAAARRGATRSTRSGASSGRPSPASSSSRGEAHGAGRQDQGAPAASPRRSVQRFSPPAGAVGCDKG